MIITDSEQRTTLAETEPKMEREPKVIKLYWMDEEEKEIIKMFLSEQKVILFVETEDFEPNQIITIPLEDNETGEKYELRGKLDILGKTKIFWTPPITPY